MSKISYRHFAKGSLTSKEQNERQTSYKRKSFKEDPQAKGDVTFELALVCVGLH